MRDHGGDLDAAMAAFGGEREAWLDLSTGINALPYPVPKLAGSAWAALPTGVDIAALARTAAAAYGAAVPAVPLAGAQAAIQIVPRLAPDGTARVLGPTYNEHGAALRAAGWRVETVDAVAALAGADLAVVVNPNNPDGRRHDPDALRALAAAVGLLVVDESFADPYPELSLAPAMPENAVVLRSFGKFYGLAGLRLGFALARTDRATRIAEFAGPWAVSGPAIAIGRAALADRDWARRTSARLAAGALRLDAAAERAGWRTLGGTSLFRLYETGDAEAAQVRLAQACIWSRRFPYACGWLRLGLPGPEADWRRLEAALS